MGKHLEFRRPFVWQMVREAVENLGGRASYKDIIGYVKGKYGDVNENTIRCQIIICTVNHPSRIHYPENNKPRDCSTLSHRCDFLFSIGKGEVVLYDPKKHGKWSIIEQNGKLQVKGPSGTLETAWRSPETRKVFTPSPWVDVRNPLLKTAIYSLMNALEFFNRGEERHRQGSLIFMDQAVEYILKAKLYQINPIKFLETQLEQLDYGLAMQEVEKCGVKLQEGEKVQLRKVHGARNYAQHRAVIPDSIWTREYIDWVYKFMKRFCQENFGIDIDSLIPPNLRVGL